MLPLKMPAQKLNTLRITIEKVGENTTVLTRGNLNVKVGQPIDSKNSLKILSTGERNDNGQRLCTRATIENPVVPSTSFQTGQSQIVTRRSNDKVT